MKKILFLLLLLMFTFTNYAMAAPDNIEDNSFISYKNIDYQFEFSYPINWRLSPSKLKGDFMIGSYENWHYFGIIITHVNNMNSIDPYKDKSLKDIVAKSHEGTIIVANSIILSEKLIDLNGLKALLVVSKKPKGIVTPEIMDETYFIFHNSCWYEISIGGPTEAFNNNRTIFNQCLASFKFLPLSLK